MVHGIARCLLPQAMTPGRGEVQDNPKRQINNYCTAYHIPPQPTEHGRKGTEKEKTTHPSLPNIRMTPDPIHERRFAQMSPSALHKRKLDIIPATPARLVPQRQHLARHLHSLKCSIVADALEERHAVAGTLPRPRRQHAMRRRRAHAARQRLHALADGNDQRARNRRTVDPGTRRVLRLQARLPGRLQQVARQHAVLVRADALARDIVAPPLLGACRGARQRDVAFGILHDLQLVLLVWVEEAGEGASGQPNSLGDQRREEDADVAHTRHVIFEYGAEARQQCSARPLVRRKQVVVERRGWGRHGMRRREVQLFAVVGVVRGGFVVELSEIS